jgi:hypothetical protein
MMLPARGFPEQDDVRTGSDGGTGTPAGPPSLTGADEAALASADEATLANTDEAAPANAGVAAPGKSDEAATTDDAGVAYDPRPASATDARPAARAGLAMDAASPAGAGPSGEAVAGDRWSDILALFVDDPRGSVAEASVMVDEAVDALIASARERQASLAASWQAADADTEQLRVALRQYRTFWSTVAQLPQPA